jgi:hypothetical protein
MDLQTEKFVKKKSVDSDLKKSLGFTLVEVLLAVSLGFVVMLAAMTFFIQGNRFFERVSAMSVADEAALFYERLTKDLRNCAVVHTGEPFTLEETRVSFVMGAAFPGSRTGEEIEPVIVTYEWNPLSKMLTRSQRRVWETQASSPKEKVLSGVASFRVTRKDGAQGLPRRVSVSVDLERQGRVSHYKKHIPIPVGYEFSK